MSTRRKVYVLNAPEDTRANLVAASTTGIPMMSVQDGSPRELICAWVAKGFTAEVIAAVAESLQVVVFTMSGDLIVNTKYSLVRQVNPEYAKGRDLNNYQNQQVYSYTTPAVIGSQATTKEALADAIVTAVAADHLRNHAVITHDGGTSFTVTEDAGYGLSVDYPGPATWYMIQVAGEIVATSSELGHKAIGDGDEMLFNQAVWTLDKTQLRSGLLEYNFDNTLPTAGKLYTTCIIKANYAMVDHDQTVPNLKDEIILYVDETSADYLENFTTALTGAVTTFA
jgi:hypothetical protein